MKSLLQLAIATTFSMGAMIGCATTTPHVATAPNLTASTSLRGVGTDLATDALVCMLGDLRDSDRCEQIARMAAVSTEALTHAEPAAVEQVSEIILQAERRAQTPLRGRMMLTRWFDSAAGAIREAHGARAGAECSNVETCTLHNGGHPSIDALEMAAQKDVSAVRNSSLLATLFKLINASGELAIDVEATALLVLQHRVNTVLHARPEVRTDAVEGLNELLATLSAFQPNTQTSSDRTAHGTLDPMSTLRDARTIATRRLTSLLPQITSAAVRLATEQSLEGSTSRSETAMSTH